jgi:hypothetical protein
VKKFWAFLRDPKNLAVIALIGGGAGWLWNEMEPSKSAEQLAITNSMIVNQNAAAENGDAINAAPGGVVISERSDVETP